MIQPGRYKARAVDAAPGFTNSGKDQVAVCFEILEGYHAGEQITWYGYFTEKTQGRTLESLRHCGWSCDDISVLTGVKDNEVQLVIDHEPDLEGNLQAKVKWVNRGGAGLALQNRMNESQKKAFAARMKGAAILSRQKNGAQQPAPAAAAADNIGPDDVDDLPF